MVDSVEVPAPSHEQSATSVFLQRLLRWQRVALVNPLAPGEAPGRLHRVSRTTDIGVFVYVTTVPGMTTPYWHAAAAADLNEFEVARRRLLQSSYVPPGADQATARRRTRLLYYAEDCLRGVGFGPCRRQPEEGHPLAGPTTEVVMVTRALTEEEVEAMAPIPEPVATSPSSGPVVGVPSTHILERLWNPCASEAELTVPRWHVKRGSFSAYFGVLQPSGTSSKYRWAVVVSYNHGTRRDWQRERLARMARQLDDVAKDLLREVGDGPIVQSDRSSFPGPCQFERAVSTAEMSYVPA